jgi:hypothetical protein
VTALLESLTHAQFAECMGSKFRILPEAASPLEVELVEANQLPGGKGAARPEPFSLLFRGPLAPILPQRIYQIEHEKLGTFGLFLVPLGPDKGRQRYEAIFN